MLFNPLQFYLSIYLSIYLSFYRMNKWKIINQSFQSKSSITIEAINHLIERRSSRCITAHCSSQHLLLFFCDHLPFLLLFFSCS